MQMKIRDYLESHKSEMIDALSVLVAIPSVRGEAEEGKPFGAAPARALEKMLDLAHESGFSVKNHENYMGTIDFDTSKETKLGVLCHLDVVPEGTGWTNPPYTLTTEGNKLLGRGTADDKGPAVAVLFALRAIRECGYTLSKNVRFLVGCDEECGSSDLAYYRTKEALPPFVFTPDASYPVINLEKGHVRGKFVKAVAAGGAKTIMRASGGVVVNAVPDRAYATLRGFSAEEVASVRALLPDGISAEMEAGADGTICLTVKGTAAHASQPESGKNAVTALLILLSALNTDDETASLFASLKTLYPYGETDGKTLSIKAEDARSGALTFVFSKFNFENGSFEGLFDSRFPISETSDGVRAKMEKALSAEGFSLAEWNGKEPHYVEEDGEFVQTLLSVYSELTGKEGYPVAIGGGTYVHEVEGGVAFGAEFPDGEDAHMHGADEFITVDSLLLNAEIFAEAILRLCR